MSLRVQRLLAAMQHPVSWYLPGQEPGCPSTAYIWKKHIIPIFQLQECKSLNTVDSDKRWILLLPSFLQQLTSQLVYSVLPDLWDRHTFLLFRRGMYAGNSLDLGMKTSHRLIRIRWWHKYSHPRTNLELGGSDVLFTMFTDKWTQSISVKSMITAFQWTGNDLFWQGGTISLAGRLCRRIDDECALKPFCYV